jgi:hypothetical protein
MKDCMRPSLVLRLFSGSQISEEAFLPLRHPFVSRGPHHHAVFVTDVDKFYDTSLHQNSR